MNERMFGIKIFLRSPLSIQINEWVLHKILDKESKSAT